MGKIGKDPGLLKQLLAAAGPRELHELLGWVHLRK
jgi:hypothetical protein